MLKKLQLKSWLLMLCMLVGVGNAWAEEVTFYPNEFTATTQADFSFEKSGVTVAVTASTVNSDQIRIFKNKTITISSTNTITGITFNCTASGTAQYGPGCFAGQEGYSYSGTVGAWVGSSNEITFTASSNQVRVTSLVVTYVSAGSTTSAKPSILGTENFLTSTEVTMSAAAGATIYYTLDGSTPTTSSQQYSAPISLTETTTVKAIAVEGDKDQSEVVSKTFTKVTPYTVAEARAAIDEGTGVTGVYATGVVSEIVTPWGQNNYQNITFNFTDEGGSDILQAFRCVSTTNADASTVAVGDIVVVYGNLTKYNSTYEFGQGCQLVSLIHNAAVEAPTFTPAAGTYASEQSVTLSCATDGATIYYTTDGTEPTSSSTAYTSAIAVSTTTTIKAIAVKGSDESTVATATYYFCSATSPYTVTQALAFNEYPANEIYVTGIVSTAPTQAPTSNGELTYYISVDGEATNQLEVYKGKGLEQAAFTAQDDIQVGDIVTIFGNVVIYGTSNPIKEFATGNYLVSFERPVSTEPVINANATLSLAYDATSGEIGYTIENSVEGTSLSANTTADWISNITVGESAVTFTTTANEGTEDRTATFTLTYGEVTKEVTVTQGHLEVDYATLPFEWEGGVKDDLLALDGVSANDLGSDYAESNAPYRVKFDTTGDYILVKTDSRPGTVTIGVKMLGGANTSTITVQGSADAESFTDVEALTISGAQNTVLTLVTSEDFAENVRFVKLLFTKGSNVGVGPITIEKYTVKQDATVSFKKDGNVITTLEANLNAEIEVAVECDVEGAELNITSSNSRVAKYEDGVVKALAEGEATITATFAGNENYKAATATLVVTVVDNRQDVTLAFNDVPAEININETATYAVTANPAVEGITYSSSAPTVVSVDENTGSIEALAVGTATITATFAGNDSYKAAEASYTIKVVNPSFVANKYEIVSDASTLKAGDEIIIVGGDGDNAYALSISQNNNNRAATSVTIASDDATISSTAEVAVITLGGEADAWTFYVTNGADQGYLYAASSSANHLKTEAEADDNAKATITIENGVSTIDFTGTNTRNRMRYNPNSGSPIFSCYASTSTAGSLVSIYRKVASSETVPGDVNKDGVPTIADVTALVNIILGKATPDTNPDYDFDAADVNGDEDISIADVTALVNIILGKTN